MISVSTLKFQESIGRLFSRDANAVSKEDVIAAGELALVCLYSGEKDESLNTLH